MKFSVTQGNLLKGLHIVNRIATTRATLPVLGNILIQTDKGRLKLVSTDLELAIETYIGAKVEIEGAITIPARTFIEFVTNNTDETIEFLLKDTVLTTKSAHFTADIKGIDATEFPTIPSIEKKNGLVIPATFFKEAIVQTVFASASDETRPVLNGVAMFVSGTELKLVATDSYRLAEKRLTIDPQKENQTAIVPSRTMLEISRLITDDMAQVVLYLDKHQLVAECGETQVISRLIEGTFPAYESIIPQSLSTTLTMNRTECIGALKVASLFSRDSAYNVSLVAEEKALTIKSLSAQIGASTSTVVASVTGPSVTISFNARFILEALQVFTNSSVQLSLQNPEGTTWYPGILKSTEDTTYQYIIMPLRTEGS